MVKVRTYLVFLTLLKFNLLRAYHEKLIFGRKSNREVFTAIWKHNYWGNKESISGPGSTIEQTANLVLALPDLIQKYGIESIFDAPCGDMNWMQIIVEKNSINYVGADIVEELIHENQKRFKLPNVKFLELDITTDDFPKNDLWLCRAIFYHLSFEDILKSLERFLESEIKYILTTNCVTPFEHKNFDIDSGGWRSLDLTKEPFNFPTEFLWEIDDFVPPHPEMKLIMWDRNMIQESIIELRKNLRL